MPMNIMKDLNYARNIVGDLAGKMARTKVSKNMLIGAGVGLGLYGASRMSNNKYVRAAGDIAGLGALGIGGYAAAGAASRYAINRGLRIPGPTASTYTERGVNFSRSAGADPRWAMRSAPKNWMKKAQRYGG